MPPEEAQNPMAPAPTQKQRKTDKHKDTVSRRFIQNHRI